MWIVQLHGMARKVWFVGACIASSSHISVLESLAISKTFKTFGPGMQTFQNKKNVTYKHKIFYNMEADMMQNISVSFEKQQQCFNNEKEQNNKLDDILLKISFVWNAYKHISMQIFKMKIMF